jgi:hypothetical protein
MIYAGLLQEKQINTRRPINRESQALNPHEIH